MFEPNVLNYFLIIMGGFGVVWGFRLFTGRRDKKIGEFEYAAFSTLWGIPVFGAFMWLMRNNSDLPSLINTMLQTPMVATPSLFVLGTFLGGIGAAALIG